MPFRNFYNPSDRRSSGDVLPRESKEASLGSVLAWGSVLVDHMGKISSILTIGAVAVGGYLAYKYLKDPLGNLFGGLAGGAGDIWGGITDFFGGIAGALGLDGKPATELKPIELAYVGPAAVAPEYDPDVHELDVYYPANGGQYSYTRADPTYASYYAALRELGIEPEPTFEPEPMPEVEPEPEQPRWRLIQALAGEVQA